MSQSPLAATNLCCGRISTCWRCETLPQNPLHLINHSQSYTCSGQYDVNLVLRPDPYVLAARESSLASMPPDLRLLRHGGVPLQCYSNHCCFAFAQRALSNMRAYSDEFHTSLSAQIGHAFRLLNWQDERAWMQKHLLGVAVLCQSIPCLIRQAHDKVADATQFAKTCNGYEIKLQLYQAGPDGSPSIFCTSTLQPSSHRLLLHV